MIEKKESKTIKAIDSQSNAEEEAVVANIRIREVTKKSQDKEVVEEVNSMREVTDRSHNTKRSRVLMKNQKHLRTTN